MRPITSFTSLLACITTALAAGSAHVDNNCAFPVYYGIGSQGGAMKLLGKSMDAPYQQGVSTSWKFNKDGNVGHVAQFEFTWADGKIWYDTSNIDGNPFIAEGTRLTPSVDSSTQFPNCVTVDCPAGQGTCTAAYNLPDDVRTRDCAETADLTFTLCSGNSGSSGGNADANAGQNTVQSSAVTVAAGNAAQSETTAATPAASTARSAQSTRTRKQRPGRHVHQNHGAQTIGI